MRTYLRVVALCATLFGSVSSWAGFAGTDVFLPSVGSARGAADWYTTVWVYNPGSAPVAATFRFLERGVSNRSPVSVSQTIPARGVRRFDDAVMSLFGVSAFGAVRVTAPSKVIVNARVYARDPAEPLSSCAGQFFAGVPASFAIGAGEQTELVGVWQTSPDVRASDFRYQLTAIGAPAPDLYIAEKVQGNRFKIAGGAPGLEVSWQVTGIRHDPWADANRVRVERDKPDKERGSYLHPEVMERLKARREARQASEQQGP